MSFRIPPCSDVHVALTKEQKDTILDISMRTKLNFSVTPRSSLFQQAI